MISIILPFYNAALTLQSSVESILKQTFQQFELILVDNASTDTSSFIATRLSETDSRIKLIYEPKQGVVFAHNRGLKEAKYNFIARMDADDIALPTKLEKQISFLQNHSEIDVVATQVGGQNLEGGFREYIEWQNSQCSPEEISLSRFTESPIANPTILFRRSVIERLGSYREGDFPEDYELFLRYLNNGVRIAKIAEVLLLWNDSSSRLTRIDTRYSQDAFYRTKTQYLLPWLKLHTPLYPKIVVWGSGEKSRKRAALLKTAGIEIQFYIDINCKQKKDCVHYTEIENAGQYFIVSYVSNWGARMKIKNYLLSKFYVEGKDFILAS